MTTPSRRELAWIVARDVNSIVGGTAAMELLRRSLGARGWLDASGHGLMVAVSRLTPGTNTFAYCVAIGWWFHRTAGSLVALAAASVPSAVVVFGLSVALVHVERNRSVRVVLAAGAIAAAGLVFSSAWSLVRPYFSRTDRVRAVAFVGGAWLLFALGLTPVRVLAVAAVAGFLTPRRRSPDAAGSASA